MTIALNSVNSSKLFFIFIFIEIWVFAFLIKKANISILIIIIEIVIFIILYSSNCSSNIDHGLSQSILDRNCRSEIIDLTYDISDKEKEQFDFCSICLDEKKESLVKLNCNHIYHKDCIKDWLRRELSCPICRCNITSV